jgi:hypothetical protein
LVFLAEAGFVGDGGVEKVWLNGGEEGRRGKQRDDDEDKY